MELHKIYSLENLPDEEWRDIPGWEGVYQISNMGRAKSLPRFVSDKLGVMRPIRSRIMHATPSGPQRTYLGFNAHDGSRISRIYIHKAVAMSFIPNPGNKPCIDHINTDSLDNRVDNLRWATYSENLSNPITAARISKAKSGKNCFFYGKRLRAKPVTCIHPDGRTESFDSIYDAAKAGYCERSIYCCIKGVYSHHRGCKWVFAQAK